MTTIEQITLETPDVTAAKKFYESAFGLGDVIRLAKGESPSSGFRGFAISLVLEQPSSVHRLFEAAVAAGGTAIKPVVKSVWGMGAAVQAPDGSVWTLATSAKKDRAPATIETPQVVMLFAVDDASKSKQFYIDHGFTVSKSFGKYIEFNKSGAVTLALYSRKALARNAGVDPEGSGSHRLVVGSDAGSFADPDGFVWA